MAGGAGARLLDSAEVILAWIHSALMPRLIVSPPHSYPGEIEAIDAPGIC